jgi:hypothetical protein
VGRSATDIALAVELPPALLAVVVGSGDREQLLARRQFALAMTVGEEAVTADSMKPVRHGMQQEAAAELVGREGQHFAIVVVAVIAPAELTWPAVSAINRLLAIESRCIVAAEIGQDGRGPGERLLGIDDPLDPPQARLSIA